MPIETGRARLRLPAVAVASERARVGLSAGAALASALLLWAASPPVGAGWLAWIALVPAAVVALRLTGSRAGRLAVPLTYAIYLELLFVPAFPFGLAEGEWGDPPPVMVGESPVIFIALLAIPLVAALLYALRFGLPWRRFEGPGPTLAVGAALVPAAAWTALDFVRVKFDPGGYWGPLFLSQHDTGAAAGAAVGGPWVLTFAIVAVNYVLAVLLVRGREAVGAAAAVAALGGVLAGTAWAVDASEPTPTGLVPAAVQPGYHTPDDDLPELRFFQRGTWYFAARDTIDDLGGLTRRAAREGANVVVWPEAAIWVDPYRYPALGASLVRLAGDAGATLVVPYFDADHRHGAAAVVEPDGGLTRPQPKQRPMWFIGERGGNKVPPEPVSASGASIGTLLGVDAEDPGLVRRVGGGGGEAPADLLASSTHDWHQLASQQRALARVNAIATGTPVARADWRFGSAVYDADGSVLADAGPDQRRLAVVGGEVGTRSTPYRALGDALGWGALAFAGLAAATLAAGHLRRRFARA